MRARIKEFLKLLLCKIFGHDYVLDIKQVYFSETMAHNSFDGESVYCKTCRQEGKMGINGKVREVQSDD